ncbi:hypothetical protein AHMF7616_03247 [Adhaeribacter pallidiroseus]|uniref:Uncharacterized protein n=2 Tax=Adhaeribacter pallidiroseus TaxID=2072847 RepID=A0A369QIA5_9BACT|nr:hypothetical protein AHMF7616_03247 [Adhaeribacter pallidiroseus]
MQDLLLSQFDEISGIEKEIYHDLNQLKGNKVKLDNLINHLSNQGILRFKEKTEGSIIYEVIEYSWRYYEFTKATPTLKNIIMNLIVFKKVF